MGVASFPAVETRSDHPPTKRLEEIGPVQILTVVFDGNHFKGEILPELERLKTIGLIRVIDLLFVRKDSMGAVATLTATDLDWEEAADFGAMVGGLIGWGVAGPEGAEIGWLAGAAESAERGVYDRGRGGAPRGWPSPRPCRPHP